MPNTNCLEGVRCPKCGQEDEFQVSGCCLMTLRDSGVSDAEDYDYSDGSSVKCTGCDFWATFKDFQIAAQQQDEDDERGAVIHHIKSLLTLMHEGGDTQILSGDLVQALRVELTQMENAAVAQRIEDSNEAHYRNQIAEFGR